MHFGQWVRKYRQDRKLSQVGCAEIAGMSGQQWNKMERLTESPKVETISKVAHAFDLSPEQVMSLAGITTSYRDQDADIAEWAARTAQRVPAGRRDEFRQMVSGIANALSA